MSVPEVAEADDGGEGDPVVDGTVDHEGIDDISQLRLQLEHSKVEEEDGYLDKVVGCWASSKGGHDPLNGQVSSLNLAGYRDSCTDPKIVRSVRCHGHIPYMLP